MNGELVRYEDNIVDAELVDSVDIEVAHPQFAECDYPLHVHTDGAEELGEWVADPYASDVDNTVVMRYLCTACFDLLCEEI